MRCFYDKYSNQTKGCESNLPEKILIIGGVAGGASAAARLRRLNEQAQIVILERGPYISYANCSLPYHVSSVI